MGVLQHDRRYHDVLQHAVVLHGSLQRASLSRPQEVVSAMVQQIENLQDRVRTAEQTCTQMCAGLSRIVHIAEPLCIAEQTCTQMCAGLSSIVGIAEPLCALQPPDTESLDEPVDDDYMSPTADAAAPTAAAAVSGR